METLFVVKEAEVKKWVFEAMRECLEKRIGSNETGSVAEKLLNRQEAAALLRISLVTLCDWTKRGLPHLRQRGRVYYLQSDLYAYLKSTFPSKLKFGDKYADYSLTGS